MKEVGSLYVVATPIGNLEDITLRALRVLRECSLVLCEDTRVGRQLLSHYEIATPTRSFHQHSGVAKIKEITAELASGRDIALITDAGTPGISDPGGLLVAAVRENLPEAKIVPIPGPSALSAAISVAGWALDKFVFLGFLPHKKGRQTMVKQALGSEYPVVIYESKYRIVKLLEEIVAWQAERRFEIFLGREISKMFETFYSGSPEVVLSEISADPNALKGEFVLILREKKVRHRAEDEPEDMEIIKKIGKY